MVECAQPLQSSGGLVTGCPSCISNQITSPALLLPSGTELWPGGQPTHRCTMNSQSHRFLMDLDKFRHRCRSGLGHGSHDKPVQGVTERTNDGAASLLDEAGDIHLSEDGHGITAVY